MSSTYDFLDDYFQEHFDEFENELTEDDFNYIFNDLIENAMCQGDGITTIDYIKKFLLDSLAEDNFEIVSTVSQDLVQKTKDECKDNPTDIYYWVFYLGTYDLEPITRHGINKYFKELIAKKEA